MDRHRSLRDSCSCGKFKVREIETTNATLRGQALHLDSAVAVIEIRTFKLFGILDEEDIPRILTKLAEVLQIEENESV